MKTEEQRRRNNLSAAKYRAANPEKVKAATQKWYAENKDKMKERYKRYDSTRPAARKEYNKIYSSKRRQRNNLLCLQHYSASLIPFCICCGDTELKFLSIDHTNNDGYKDKKKRGAKFYEQLIKNNYPNIPALQVMCMSCNWGRARNLGICPHKQIKQSYSC